MAKETPISYRNLVLYEIYVRNHSESGTFTGVEADLERIRALGVDIVWFMPIHPIGKLNKKGSLGCPYSIRDYREVNPEYGTKQDFARLIEKAHSLGLKVMIDVVFNHTAHDSVLVKDHPEFFHQDENGNPVTTVPEWSDVIDLKHPHPELTAYLIETLVEWAMFGVDGFRCDVASLIPIDFWLEARQAVAQVKPGVIWLAESVHAAFVGDRRAHNLSGLSDSEVYQAFDMTYDYDIWPLWQLVVQGKLPVRRYVEMLRFQDCIYPQNFIKMRCVENHDQPRIMKLTAYPNRALAWTAFQAFNKGSFLIYAGQESSSDHTPSLFEIDKIDWKDYPFQQVLFSLSRLKKSEIQMAGRFIIVKAEPAIQAVWSHPQGSLYGIFNITGSQGFISVHLADGTYIDELSHTAVQVKNGKLMLPNSAVILNCDTSLELNPAYCELLDYHVPLA